MTRAPEIVILHLGGGLHRISTTMTLARLMPRSRVIFSSESAPHVCIASCHGAGISLDRVYLDFAAWDTVTNLTETIARGAQHNSMTVYIVSDDWHLERRVRWIAKAAFWRTGVKVRMSPSLVTTPRPATETPWLALRDAARAWVWRLTGYCYPNAGLKRQRWATIQGYKAEADRLLAETP